MVSNREKILGKKAATNGKPKTRKLCIICSKGSLDMAYPPLILANAARMTGIEVDLFFTFWGMDIITDSKVDKLHLATVGQFQALRRERDIQDLRDGIVAVGPGLPVPGLDREWPCPEVGDAGQ